MDLMHCVSYREEIQKMIDRINRDISLKRCPFCGSEAIPFDGSRCAWIECSNKSCGCGFSPADSIEEAAKAWNRRTGE